MKKYTYKEVAEIIGISQSLVNGKTKRKKFPKEFKTTVVNENGREVKALTEEGLQRLKDDYGITDNKIDEENKTLLGNLELVKQGEFLGTKCDFYKDTNDNIYMTREQIAEALQYKSVKAISQMHFRYKERMNAESVEITRFKNILQNVVGVKSSEMNPNTLLYSERGVYDICFYSNQPRAIEFKDWVMDRVTEIRKFGFTTQTNEDGTHNVQAMAEFLHGKEESAGKLAFVALAEWKIKATMELAKQKDLITVQNEELNKQKPKVQFAEQVAGSNDVISVNAMAKLLHKNGIDIGQNRLYEWLRANKLVMRMKQNKQWVNVPTQMAVDKGFLSIEETTFTDKYGKQRISAITRVTPKGQYVILNKFLSNNGVMN